MTVDDASVGIFQIYITDAIGSWVLKFEVFLDCATKKAITGTLVYKLGDTGVSGTKGISLSGDNRHVSYSISVIIPQVWDMLILLSRLMIKPTK